jgi:uncharacterized CHY-type Zn-finger protein
VTPSAGHRSIPPNPGALAVTPSAGHSASLGSAPVGASAVESAAILRETTTGADAVVVRGPAIDAETRCVHYGSALDVVALRAPCCDAWYPCHLCHAAVAGHPLAVIPRAEHHLPAALCGVCRATMSVPEYLAADSCPSCGAAFNPGCAAHAHLYFAP